MSRDVLQTGILAGLAALCLALVMGCSRVPDESREARDRHMRRAAAAMKDQNTDEAIVWYEKALERRPNRALAHRKLGMIFQNVRQDYVSALYHYNRYLQLRPESEHRSDIEGFIQDCRMSYAAQIAAFPEELKRDIQARNDRIQRLEIEVASLRAAQADRSPSLSPEHPGETASAMNSDSAAPRIHVVEAGENLATISTRYYGTPSRWKYIFNANQGRLTDANNIRVGTRLNIPELK